MGNHVRKNYVIDESGFAQGGAFLKWKCASGHHYSRPQDSVTLFVFEKKTIPSSLNDIQKERLLNTLRRDAKVLQKLRHPSILPVTESLGEDAGSLCFVTRHVTQTLASYFDVLQQERSVSSNQFPLEAKSGLYNICEAVAFLHNDAKMVHLNISPTSIFLTSHFRWYLGSFGFSMNLMDFTNHMVKEDTALDFQSASKCSSPLFSMTPHLAYSAPELSNSAPSYSSASDIYSLGLILLQVVHPNAMPAFKLMNSHDIIEHQKQSANLVSRIQSLPLPSNFFSLLSRMLNPNPSLRPSINEVLESTFFNDVSILILRFSDRFAEKTELQKVEFLRKLGRVLRESPEIFNDNMELFRYRVLLPLLGGIANPNLTVVLLLVIFPLFPNCIDKQTFNTLIWDKFKPLLHFKKIHAEAAFLIVDHVHYLIEFSDTMDMIQNDIVPFLVNCLGTKMDGLQVKTLRALSKSIPFIPYTVFVKYILPAVLRSLSSSDTSTGVRTECLAFLSLVSNRLDGRVINDLLLKHMRQILEVDSTPAISIACCEVLRKLLHIIGFQRGSTNIFPLLIMCLCNEKLNLQQYDLILSIVLNEIQTFSQKRRQNLEESQVWKNTQPTPSILSHPFDSPPRVEPGNTLSVMAIMCKSSLVETSCYDSSLVSSNTVTPFHSYRVISPSSTETPFNFDPMTGNSKFDNSHGHHELDLLLKSSVTESKKNSVSSLSGKCYQGSIDLSSYDVLPVQDKQKNDDPFAQLFQSMVSQNTSVLHGKNTPSIL